MKTAILKILILLFALINIALGQSIEKIATIGNTWKWNTIQDAEIFKFNRIVTLVQGYNGWTIQIYNDDLTPIRTILSISQNDIPETFNLIEKVRIDKSMTGHLIISFKLKTDDIIYHDSLKISNKEIIIYDVVQNNLYYEDNGKQSHSLNESDIEFSQYKNEISYKLKNENEYKRLCFESNLDSIPQNVIFLCQDNVTGYIIFPSGFEYLNFCQDFISLSRYQQACIRFKLWQPSKKLTLSIPNFNLNQDYDGFIGDTINLQTSSCCSEFSFSTEFSVELTSNFIPDKETIVLLKERGLANKLFSVNIPCSLSTGIYFIRLTTVINNERISTLPLRIKITNPLSYSINITKNYISPNDSVLVEVKDFYGKEMTWLSDSYLPISSSEKTLLSCPGKYYLRLTTANKCDSMILYNLNKPINDTTLIINNYPAISKPNIESNKPTFINNINLAVKETLSNSIKNPIIFIIIHILIIIFSSIVFSLKSNLKEVNLNNESDIYFHSIFYSIDLVTPIIDLNCSKHFIPKKETKWDKFRWHVYRILILWGWIFTTFISSVLITSLSTYYNKVF